MWTVVWPIINTSPNGVHCVATGVDDSPKLAHQGHVQLGVRELTILASCSQDIVGRKLGAAASPVLNQCTAATCGQNAGHHVFLRKCQFVVVERKNRQGGCGVQEEGMLFCRIIIKSCNVIHRLVSLTYHHQMYQLAACPPLLYPYLYNIRCYFWKFIIM